MEEACRLVERERTAVWAHRNAQANGEGCGRAERVCGGREGEQGAMRQSRGARREQAISRALAEYT